MKKINKILLCFSLTMLFSIKLEKLFAQAKLEAEFIQLAIIANTGTNDSIGHFEEETIGLWKSYINKVVREYKEDSRDLWSVYLTATDNGESVAIDAWQMWVKINGEIKYKITRVSDDVIPEEAEPATIIGGGNPVINPPPVVQTTANGRTVQSATVANTGSAAIIGSFEKEQGGGWRSNLNNSIRRYQETGRDDWSVYLTATDNNENVIINLWQKNVSFNGNPVYTITQSSTQATTTTGGAAPTTVVTPAVTTVSNDKDIAAYISGLSYDPRILLSVREAGSSEAIALPANGIKNRTPKENGVVICTKVPRKLDEKMESISIFKPTSGVIFPGALVLANRTLAEGLPTPVTMKRSPVTLRVDLPGLTNNGTKVISSPKNSSVQDGINQVLEEWNQNPASQGYINPATSKSKFERAYSSEQLALSLGFRLDWADNFFKAGAKVNTNSETDVTVAFFQQVFYTVTMDPPEKPSDVFDPSVTVADVRNVISNNAPAGYVRSVDYGRTIMVRMESTLKASNVALEAAVQFATAGGVNVSANTQDTINNLLKNSRFSVYTVGGNAQNAAPLSFMGSADLSRLKQVVNTDATYRRGNPGVPISYTVAFLKDNTTASVNSTSDYVETQCTEFPNAFIKLVHNGAYVGRFSVTWQEPNEQGILTSKPPFISGEKTSGYTYSLPLPGDAVNIQIKGEAATGLAWDPWGEAMNITLTSPTNCTYTIIGTTLNRNYQKSNCPGR